MKIVFHHSVAAGGAAMPTPALGTWAEKECAHALYEILDSVKSMLDWQHGVVAELANYAVGGIVEAVGKSLAEQISLLPKKEFFIPAGPITCHRCRSTGGRHTPRCRR